MDSFGYIIMVDRPKPGSDEAECRLKSFIVLECWL